MFSSFSKALGDLYKVVQPLQALVLGYKIGALVHPFHIEAFSG